MSNFQNGQSSFASYSIEDQYPFPSFMEQKHHYKSDLFDTLLRQNSELSIPFNNQIPDNKSINLLEIDKKYEKREIQKQKKEESKKNLCKRRIIRKNKKKERKMRNSKEKWSDISEDEIDEGSEWDKQNEQQNEQDELKTKKKKVNIRLKRISLKKNTKNLLINFKLLFVKYIKNNCSIQNNKYLIEFQKNKCLTRRDYQGIFRREQLRQTIMRMFEQRYLERELQLTRVQYFLKTVYLKKISVFKKGFQKKWLPRIN